MNVKHHFAVQFQCNWGQWSEWSLTSSEEVKPGTTKVVYGRERKSVINTNNLPAIEPCTGHDKETKEVLSE